MAQTAQTFNLVRAILLVIEYVYQDRRIQQESCHLTRRFSPGPYHLLAGAHSADPCGGPLAQFRMIAVLPASGSALNRLIQSPAANFALSGFRKKGAAAAFADKGINRFNQRCRQDHVGSGGHDLSPTPMGLLYPMGRYIAISGKPVCWTEPPPARLHGGPRSLRCQLEIHGYAGDHLDRLAVQQGRLIAPLPHSVHRGTRQFGVDQGVHRLDIQQLAVL